MTRKGAFINRKGAFINRKGAFMTRKGAFINRKGAFMRRKGACKTAAAPLAVRGPALPMPIAFSTPGRLKAMSCRGAQGQPRETIRRQRPASTGSSPAPFPKGVATRLGCLRKAPVSVISRAFSEPAILFTGQFARPQNAASPLRFVCP
ncbi:MAG: hypothetical protein LBE17_12475 [Treponema sp.]|jgi:hypothetical protein|nr:hypothetical protein [Treponema sp.]